ncbi:hypothetical protein KQ304_10065 [Synechococcus sp. CS-1329]|uniref:hypothetical protein n=1 Tax=Synechococcus sp. CS-1329 TaxID=2847975 RepID=UPI00223C03AC|nr:hypothetical protein [Synechococcus sp. CS-1329]MCT0219337.1 hypothetical protein [Synechococcus sp. CS-1329]
MTSPPPRIQLPASGASPAAATQQDLPPQPSEAVLCNHCGRTASNGISCQGYCVADSDY